jgi:hypothetical protein
MSDEHRGPELVRDDALTVALRAIYRAPSDEAYWTALEQRIMSGVGQVEVGDAWRTMPERFVRVGLIAASAALVIAGGLFLRAQAGLDHQMAAETITEVEGLESALAQREPMSQDEATVRRLTGRH